jgi:hypothetical protein
MSCRYPAASASPVLPSATAVSADKSAASATKMIPASAAASPVLINVMAWFRSLG